MNRETSAVSAADTESIRRQLGRPPRGVHAIAHRCKCGKPDVVETVPRLADGTPFPTFYYATCPKLTGEISTLESSGLMAEMNAALESEPELAGAYHAAHDDYLAARAALQISVPEIDEISAGGMPNRVKCLHVLVAHSLAAGPGVNPLGDRALALLPDWWRSRVCG